MLLITCGEVIMKDGGDRDDLVQDPYSFKAQPYWVQWLAPAPAASRRQALPHNRLDGLDRSLGV